ncbi:glutamyl-tRNA reductase, partial [Brevibacterium paucivorans]
GAGAMSGLTVKTLKDHGLKRIRVINRTLDKAQRLAQSVDGEAVELTQENLVREIAQADVIVSVTGARGIVLDEDTVIASLQQDLDQKLNKFFIDLALPYDIAVEVGELPHIR